MSVGKLCVRKVDTAEPSESVAVIAERMRQRSVGTLVVVNHLGQVVGIITDRDLVVRVLAKGLNPTTTFLHEVMTVAPKTIGEKTPLETALLIMRTGRFRRVPVVDSHYGLVGIVTLDDVLILLAEEFTQIGRLLKRETPRAIANQRQFSVVNRLQNDRRISKGD
jgi:CBS domain-containing protein